MEACDASRGDAQRGLVLAKSFIQKKKNFKERLKEMPLGHWTELWQTVLVGCSVLGVLGKL